MHKEDRVLLNNIVLRQGNGYLIMNLINFRRQYINEEEWQIMKSIEKKKIFQLELSEQENMFYKILIDKKQVLTEEMVSIYEKKRNLLEIKEFRLIPQIKSIMINVSYKCNFCCEYCYQKDFISGEKITIEKVDYLYDFLQNYYNKIEETFEINEIVISGGEPLLDENLDTVQYIINKFNDKCKKIILFTNGTLLMQQMDKINLKGVSNFQISIDGTDKVIESVNHYHEKGILDKILKSINILRQDESVNISIAIMLCETVVENFEDLVQKLENYDLLSAKNIKIAIVSDLNFDRPQNREKCIYKNEAEYIRLKEKIQTIIGNRNIQWQQPDSIASFYKALTRPLETRWKGKISNCEVDLDFPIAFGPEGNIYWCTCINPKRGIIGRYYPDYYIDEAQINNYRYRSIYNQEECSECEFRYLCGGGCLLKSIKNETQVYCGLWRNSYFLENMEKFF